ncbi:MAG: DUF5711 family protein [Lachnospiraceae bacterium]|nr:DUF5711 family protein [Lachnospiraceae bacterium]
MSRNREKKDMAEMRRLHKNVTFAGGSEDVAEENVARSQRGHLKTTVIIVILVLLIGAGVAVSVYMHLRSFNGIKVISKTEIKYEANAQYLEFGKNLLKYTPDGVSYIDENGNVVWTAGVDFKVPIAETRGNYAVVADKGGNVVAVFNLEGEVSEVKMPYEICDIDVSETGAFTAILESSETNYINMYSSTGEKIYEIQTSINKSGYPLDMSVSDNGEKLFTSYFRLDGVNIKNNLTAYNFGEVGQNENADRMVGGQTFDEEMFPKLQFLTNDVVAAFSDSEIILYTMKEKPVERAKIAFNTEVNSIFYCDSYVGFIAKAESASAENEYVISAYDLSGKKMFDYNFSFDYEKVYTNSQEIIVTGGNQCLMVSASGQKKFSYAFADMVKSVIPSAGRNEYIVTFDDRTEKIRLVTEEN